MKKQLLLLLITASILIGCEKTADTSVKKEVSLTEKELKEINGNPTTAAQMLVRKAILNEVKGEKYTEEEKKSIDIIKENVEIEYFLNKKAQEVVIIDNNEIAKLYENNKENFKNVSKEQALAYLKEQVFLHRMDAEKTKYINILITDYGLNKKITEYFPELKEDNIKIN